MWPLCFVQERMVTSAVFEGSYGAEYSKTQV